MRVLIVGYLGPGALECSYGIYMAHLEFHRQRLPQEVAHFRDGYVAACAIERGCCCGTSLRA